MEQPTIFGEQFTMAFQLRRRRLLPVVLKVYIWIGFLITVVCLAVLLYTVCDDLFVRHRYRRQDSIFLVVMELSVGLGLITIFFTAVASLWFEAKWAIRYNWIIGGLVFACILFIGAIIFGEMSLYDMGVFVGPALTIPYFIMLYKIQYRWEHVAVSKKETLGASTMK